MNNDPVVIAAVIPTYNRANLLLRAIESVLTQTYQPAEIIVVDDGSEDETSEIMRNYSDQVHYCYQPNSGASAARNTGINLASSPWIAFLDSDDYWDEGYLERIASAIVETDGIADVYFSDAIAPEAPDSDEKSLWRVTNFQVNEQYRLVEDGTPWALIPSEQPFRIQGSTVRRSKCLALGGFNEDMKVLEEQHLLLRLGVGSPMCAVKGVAYYHGYEAQNRLTGNKGRIWAENSAIMFDDLLSTDILPAQSKATIRQLQGQAHSKLAKYDRQEGNWSGFLRHLGIAVYNSPHGFLERLRKRI